MATEKRLIYMDDTIEKLRAYAERKHEAGHTELANGILKGANYIHNNIVRVDAVEVVHGHWSQKDIISKKAGYGVRYYYHAECEVAPCRLFECAHDYCPNCGAKMDGDGNG